MRIADDIQLIAPAPTAVENSTAQTIGPSGLSQFYYWWVTQFPIGSVVTGPVFLRNAPDDFSLDNYVLFSGDPVVGAIKYDALRTDTPEFPSGPGDYAINTGLSTPIAKDFGRLSFYENAGLRAGAPVSCNINLNNRDFAKPTIDVKACQLSVSTLVFPDGSTQSTAGGGGGGEVGPPGPPGPQGPPGAAATINVGTTTTGTPGSGALVTNSGSSSAAVFDFRIPTGFTGPAGPAGPQGPPGTGLTIKGSVPSAADLPTTGNQNGDAYVTSDTGDLWVWDGTAWSNVGPIQGPEGPPGPQGPPGPAASQTPWMSNIDGNGFNLTGVNGITATSGITSASLTTQTIHPTTSPLAVTGAVNIQSPGVALLVGPGQSQFASAAFSDDLIANGGIDTPDLRATNSLTTPLLAVTTIQPVTTATKVTINLSTGLNFTNWTGTDLITLNNNPWSPRYWSQNVNTLFYGITNLPYAKFQSSNTGLGVWMQVQENGNLLIGPGTASLPAASTAVFTLTQTGNLTINGTLTANGTGTNTLNGPLVINNAPFTINGSNTLPVFKATALGELLVGYDSGVGRARIYIDNLGHMAFGLASTTYLIQLATDSAAKPTTNTWTIPSDIRTKQNVKKLEGGLEVIRQLHPIEAQYNGKAHTPKGGRVVSFDPDELKKVLPNAVSTVKTKLDPSDSQATDVQGVNIHEVLFHMFLAIQDLDARFTQLERKPAEKETRWPLRTKSPRH